MSYLENHVESRKSCQIEKTVSYLESWYSILDRTALVSKCGGNTQLWYMREIEKITSRDNQRLVHARRVRDGKVPELIFVEGRRLIEEALRSGLSIDECFVNADLAVEEKAAAVIEKSGFAAEVPDRIFGSLADTKQSQGIILIAKRPQTSAGSIEKSLTRSKLPVVVFLKEINNPSNLGAVLRTVEAAGGAGVIVSKGSADVYSPKALRAAMGAAFRLPIWDAVNFDDAIQWAQAANLRTTATAASGTRSYVEIDWKEPRLLIFGSEAHGLSDEEVDAVDDAITIPMENEVESLNLAVSTGIILFEAKRHMSIG